MKVWIVETVTPYEGCYIEKVFATKEKALEWVNNEDDSLLEVNEYEVE